MHLGLCAFLKTNSVFDNSYFLYDCRLGGDYVELLMLDTYLNASTISEILVSVGSGINSFKWLFSILTYLIIFIGIITSLKRFLIKLK